MTKAKKVTKSRKGQSASKARLERNRCPLCGTMSGIVYGEFGSSYDGDVYWCVPCQASWPTEWNTKAPENEVKQYAF